MNDMPSNMSEILKTNWDEVERPKPLPQGSYACTVMSFQFGESDKKQTPYVEFTLQPYEAAEDVDTDALEKMGGLANRTLRATYYTTKPAEWRLKEFCQNCGLVVKGKTIEESLAEIIGCQVLVHISHSPNKSGTAMFANIDQTALIA